MSEPRPDKTQEAQDKESRAFIKIGKAYFRYGDLVCVRWDGSSGKEVRVSLERKVDGYSTVSVECSQKEFDRLDTELYLLRDD